MRILPPSRFLPGFEPAQLELNTEEGILDISSPSTCELIDEKKIIAETLILRCHLRPLPLLNKNIKVRLISEGNSLNETLLYDTDSVTYGYEREVELSMWRGIALDYTGLGRGIYQEESFVFYGKDLPEGRIEGDNPIYVKPFLVETQNHAERSTSLTSGQTLVSPPGALNATILRGYGGYYKEGLKLEDIQQVYYSLTAVEDQTRVRLFSSSLLLEQHTPPPLGGREFNHDFLFNPLPHKEQYLSLSGSLAAGFCYLMVSTECGVTRFQSYLGEPVFGHPTLFNIYFKPHS